MRLQTYAPLVAEWEAAQDRHEGIFLAGAERLLARMARLTGIGESARAGCIGHRYGGDPNARGQRPGEGESLMPSPGRDRA